MTAPRLTDHLQAERRRLEASKSADVVVRRPVLATLFAIAEAATPHGIDTGNLAELLECVLE